MLLSRMPKYGGFSTSSSINASTSLSIYSFPGKADGRFDINLVNPKMMKLSIKGMSSQRRIRKLVDKLLKKYNKNFFTSLEEINLELDRNYTPVIDLINLLPVGVNCIDSTTIKYKPSLTTIENEFEEEKKVLETVSRISRKVSIEFVDRFHGDKLAQYLSPFLKNQSIDDFTFKFADISAVISDCHLVKVNSTGYEQVNRFLPSVSLYLTNLKTFQIDIIAYLNISSCFRDFGCNVSIELISSNLFERHFLNSSEQHKLEVLCTLLDSNKLFLKETFSIEVVYRQKFFWQLLLTHQVKNLNAFTYLVFEEPIYSPEYPEIESMCRFMMKLSSQL